MATIASNASQLLRAPVVDKTGLVGLYRYTLFHSREGLPLFASVAAGREAAADDVALPSYSSALREQLGLKLERGKTSVPTLTIEAVSMPSDN